MSQHRKVARAPRQQVKDRRSNKRHDASKASFRLLRPSMPCGRSACGLSFVPDRIGQIYCTPSCRKADWLDRHYVKREAPEAGVGAQRQRDAEWTRAILGRAAGDKVLTPSEAAAWLQENRVHRAAGVVNAARFKGAPKWS